MILEFCRQRIESIQEDRMVKVRFAIQAAFYKATGSCDWQISIADDVINHCGQHFYDLQVYCRRSRSLDLESGKREYQDLKFNIVGEELTLKDVFVEAVGEIRKWAHS